jgi:hypothetical protein
VARPIARTKAIRRGALLLAISSKAGGQASSGARRKGLFSLFICHCSYVTAHAILLASRDDASGLARMLT